MELIRSYYFHQRRPSPNTRWVGSCINRFEACSAFTHVTACMLAKSPTRPSTPEAPTASFPSPPLRLLPGGANSSRAGLSPAVNQRLSRRTQFLDLVRSNDDMGNDYIENDFMSPTTEEIMKARPLAMVLPEDVVTHATLIAASLCPGIE